MREAPCGRAQRADGNDSWGPAVVTARDREVVAWVGRLGAAGATDVRVRFGLGRTAGYRRLAACVERELLEQVRLLHGEPGLYVATRAGLRWAGLEQLGPCRVSVGAFEHWQACATLAAALGAGGHEVWSERDLRTAERESGRLIASVRVGQAERLHQPDLVLRPGTEGERVAVEVELSVKSAHRLEAICRGWARARHLAGVRYYAAPAPARAVQRAVREVRAEDVIEIRPLPWADVNHSTGGLCASPS